MLQYTPQKYLPHEYTLVSPTIDTLKFDSKFESGNLWQAIKINEDEYNLMLEYDIETQGYTQWYYFSVSNYKEGHTVKFNILNLMKPNSLYSQGLLPLAKSTELSNKIGVSWHRAGKHVSYYQNNIPRKYLVQGVPAFYYTLTFTYTFEYANDKVFFSHCYPYTYTDLIEYLNDLSLNPFYSNRLKISTLCKTLAGNECPILTITENIDSYENYVFGLTRSRTQKQKKAIVLTSRVHPGESNSSYIIKGAIDYLLSNSHNARSLRKNFVFKIIPMLNPDGVVYGNYRCSLLGVDLNRRWKEPNHILHPTIFHAKELIGSLRQHNSLFFYCDIHGHSSKKGTFMYACKTKGISLIEQKENIYLRLIPLMFGKRDPWFDYRNCSFRIERIKETTARVVVFKEFSVLTSYTLETSFLGNSSSEVFDDYKLYEIGAKLCHILSFFRTASKLQKAVEAIYKGIIEVPQDSDFDLGQAIETINPECLENVLPEDGSALSESDSAGSENDDKKLHFKLFSSKIKIKKKTKRINPPIIKAFPKTPPTCAPSSLARSTSTKKLSSGLNSTAIFRVRKTSFRKFKALNQTNS